MAAHGGFLEDTRWVVVPPWPRYRQTQRPTRGYATTLLLNTARHVGGAASRSPVPKAHHIAIVGLQPPLSVLAVTMAMRSVRYVEYVTLRLDPPRHLLLPPRPFPCVITRRFRLMVTRDTTLVYATRSRMLMILGAMTPSMGALLA